MNNKILIEIKNISKTYKEFSVLKNINCTVFENEIITLLGVNGAGKTTLSNIIIGLNPPTSGDIYYKNESIYKNLIEYKKIIGVCFQAPNLDQNLTLYDILYYSGKFFGLDTKTVENRIKELEAEFKLTKYLNCNASILSGGYKQRFMIARALMHSPKLLILDEPTVGLDPDIRRNLWNYIKQLKEKNITVLLTTHYLDEAEILSDRVCILEQGVIKTIDTPQNLIKNHTVDNLEAAFLKIINEEN